MTSYFFGVVKWQTKCGSLFIINLLFQVLNLLFQIVDLLFQVVNLFFFFSSCESVFFSSHESVILSWNGQYKNTGWLKPVLRVPNLALSFSDHLSKRSFLHPIEAPYEI